ncbi:DUF3971 domain-containing protein [Amorphus coralli]|uniref:YhdP family protein n=1 Tax=Amorphus coralli TaxID=340680 RepID=UPI0003647630|nr:AsmA-like C-terminal region-containing protein [Amorphus coralli]
MRAGRGPTRLFHPHLFCGGRSRPRKAARLAFFAAAGLALLVVLLVIRVYSAPLTIPIADRTVRTILTSLAGEDGRVAVGGVSLGWAPGSALEIVVREVSIRGPAGTLEAPKSVFDISAAALLKGEVRVHSIEIIDPALSVNYPVRSADDQTGEVQQRPDPPLSFGFLPEVEQRLARLAAIARQNGLKQFRLSGGEIRIPDPDPRLPDRVFSGIDGTALPETDGDVAIDVRGQAHSGAWRYTIERSTIADGSRLVAGGHGVGLTDIIALPIIESGFSLAPELVAWFSPEGDLERARLQLGVDKGVFKIAKDPPRTIDRLLVAATWDAKDDVVRVEPLEIVAGATLLVGKGTFTPPRDDGDTWTYELSADTARMGPDDVDGPPLDIPVLNVSGTIVPSRSYLTFDRFVARSVQGAMMGSGSFDFGPHGPNLAAALSLSPMSAATLMRMWPVIVGYEARNWLVENVRSGQIESGEMLFALLPRDMDGDPSTQSSMKRNIDIAVTYRDGSLVLPGDLPAMIDATGSATVVDRHVTLDASSAALVPPEGGRIAVEDFYVDIPSVTAKPPIGTIRTRLEGAAAAIASLVDLEPIDALGRIGVTPADLSGSISAAIEAVGPMGQTIEPDALKWSVDAQLSDVASKAPINGMTVSGATLSVIADPTEATLKGKATVDGVTATIDYTAVFSGADEGRAGDVSFVLTEAERKKRGWDVGSLLGGPIEITVVDSTDGKRRVEANLKDARLTVPGFGWTKGAGVPAKASFDLVEDEKTVEVNDLKVTSDGLDVTGKVRIENGELVSAIFDRFALRPTDKAKLTVTRSGKGYDVVVKGSSLDGRGLLSSFKNQADEGGTGGSGLGGPLNLRMDLATVQGNGGVSLTGLTGSLSMSGDQLTALDLTGSSNGGRSRDIVARLTPGGNGTRTLSVDAADTGRLLRFLGLYQRLAGGQGRLDATLRRRQPTIGEVTVRNFEITDDPQVASLIDRTVRSAGRSASDPRPLAFQPSRDARTTAGFEELNVPFTEDKGRIQITDAVLRGAAIGGTAGGVLDLKGDRMTITGTVIPAYAINNLFGRVPILGEILGGGKDGGLFGVTFRLDGPMKSPTFSFNPVSAVTPGIFRRLFEAEDADGAPAYPAPAPRDARNNRY